MYIHIYIYIYIYYIYHIYIYIHLYIYINTYITYIFHGCVIIFTEYANMLTKDTIESG